MSCARCPIFNAVFEGTEDEVSFEVSPCAGCLVGDEP